MTQTTKSSAYGQLVEPSVLKLERLLPGPIERVWEYLTKSELRRQWLASGEMPPVPGTPFEFVWRNDDLSGGSAHRPDGRGETERLQSRVLEYDPPRRLAVSWGIEGNVTFDLEPQDGSVLLTLTHSRIPDRHTLLDVSGGWHVHLDILAAITAAAPAPTFWDNWVKLRDDYARRFPE